MQQKLQVARGHLSDALTWMVPLLDSDRKERLAALQKDVRLKEEAADQAKSDLELLKLQRSQSLRRHNAKAVQVSVAP